MFGKSSIVYAVFFLLFVGAAWLLFPHFWDIVRAFLASSLVAGGAVLASDPYGQIERRGHDYVFVDVSGISHRASASFALLARTYVDVANSLFNGKLDKLGYSGKMKVYQHCLDKLRTSYYSKRYWLDGSNRQRYANTGFVWFDRPDRPTITYSLWTVYDHCIPVLIQLDDSKGVFVWYAIREVSLNSRGILDRVKISPRMGDDNRVYTTILYW